jgi:biopolymer transport protein ExbD
LEVPRAVTSEYAQGEFQTIVIEADGTFIVNGRNADAAGLRVFLDQFKNRQDVIVLQADKKTSVDAVVGVMDLCRGRGLRRVMITTQK